MIVLHLSKTSTRSGRDIESPYNILAIDYVILIDQKFFPIPKGEDLRGWREERKTGRGQGGRFLFRFFIKIAKGIKMGILITFFCQIKSVKFIYFEQLKYVR